MFGPDSGKNGWMGLNFVYEKTRIDKVVLEPGTYKLEKGGADGLNDMSNDAFTDGQGRVHSVHEDSEAHIEGVDRMERFLSIWEEEGCRMVRMNCQEHDAYAANSQFITHLMGRILGSQGLAKTPIDTSGFESVLKLVGSTTADSFELFYGLYKYNGNSVATINQLRAALDDVVRDLKAKEEEEQSKSVNDATTSIPRCSSLSLPYSQARDNLLLLQQFAETEKFHGDTGTTLIIGFVQHDTGRASCSWYSVADGNPHSRLS